MTLITEIGIHGYDGNIWLFAGKCQDCGDFWVYGGFEDYCSDCV